MYQVTEQSRAHDRYTARAGSCAAILLAILWSLLTPARADDCVAPQRPVLPDGATATMDDMLAGQNAVKAFQASNMDYMHCLEQAFTTAKAAVSEAMSGDTRTIANAEHSQAVEAYNAAVSAEEEVAGAFNIELREYRAANRQNDE